MLGFGFGGAATGTVLLSRAAAADMYPPERRPRAIAQVLFGAVFGALLGPLVFSPLLEGGEGLDVAWLGAAGFMLVGLIVISRLRPDPQQIARAIDPHPAAPATASAPISRIVTRPGVPVALLAAVASWSGMVGVMALTGAAMLDHGHSQGSVFPVLSAHFVGMFALFGVVGPVIERIGRLRAIAAGLLLLAGSAIALLPAVDSVPLTALVLFGVGLGWNLSFVAATAELAERAEPAERASLIGFSDLLANMTGAALVAAGGFALEQLGLVAVCVGAAALPVLAAVWMIREPRVAPELGRAGG
jgi:MFS family permease